MATRKSSGNNTSVQRLSSEESLETEELAGHLIEFDQFLKCKDLMRHLAATHTFFGKKVKASDHLASCIVGLLETEGFIRSKMLCSVSELQKEEFQKQGLDSPSILLVSSTAPEEDIDEFTNSILDLAENDGFTVWLVSFFSLLDRRTLTRFSSFFSFASSPTELDVLSDILPIPAQPIEALARSYDSVLFFTTKQYSKENQPNPCLVKLPHELTTGILPRPSVHTDLLYKRLPSGRLSHLYARDHLPPLRHKLRNYTLNSYTITLACCLDGYSTASPLTVPLVPGQSEVRYQYPFLESTRKIEEARNAKLSVEITMAREGKIVHQEKLPYDVEVLPWNFLRWSVPEDISGESYKDLTHHIAAFVTPRTKEVRAIYQRAKELATNLKDSAWSPKTNHDVQAVIAKVEAIYNALKERHLKWDTNSVMPGSVEWGVQEIRLPSQTLEENQGNCVDISVLFASVLGRAGISPLLLVQPKHVNVGWKVRVQAGGEPETHSFFLEATYLTDGEHDFDFEIAMKDGRDRHMRLQQRGWLERDLYDEDGFAKIVDVEQCRSGDKAVLPLEP